MSTLVAAFKAALAVRGEVAARVRGHRDRAARLAMDVDLAERENGEAKEAFETVLAAVACGEVVDVNAARERRDLAVERLAELRTMAEGLRSRLATVEAELDTARRAAAGAQKRLALEIAAHREAELRASAEGFALAWRAWLRTAKTANASAFAETGVRGDPIAVGGPANLLIRGGGLTDEGLRGILGRHGVKTDPLQISNLVDDVLTEAALLAEADGATDLNTTNGATIAQQENAHV